MGKFFNEKLMTAKRIPHITTRKDNPVESMRVAFNEAYKPANVEVVEVKGESNPETINYRLANLQKPLTARQIRERSG